MARFDYQIDSNNRWTARYARNRPDNISPSLPPSQSAWFSRIESCEFEFYSLLGELDFGKQARLHGKQHEPNGWVLGFPLCAGCNCLGVLQLRRNLSQGGGNWSLEEVLAHVRGRHSLKFGGIYKHILAHRSGQNLNAFSYATLSDFINNIPSSTSFDFGLEELFLTQFTTGYFIQDDVRLTQRLMLNLGMRWDYYSVFQERDNRIFNRGIHSVWAASAP